MRLGNKNVAHGYRAGNPVLGASDSFEDLGVTVDSSYT